MKHTKKISFQEEKAPLLRKEGLGVIKKSSLKSWKWLCYILLLSLASCKPCKKTVDPLPPETQTGANTFGCLIDGKPYIPDGSGGFGGAKPVSGGYYRDYQVWIRTYRKDGWDFSIFLENVGNRTGKYSLNFTTAGKPTEFRSS